MSDAIDKLIETASAIVAETPDEGGTAPRYSGHHPSSLVRRVFIVELQNALAQLGKRVPICQPIGNSERGVQSL